MHREQNAYDPRAIIIRSPNDRVPARLLQKALNHSRRRDHAGRPLLHHSSEGVCTIISEIYKISAFIKAQRAISSGLKKTTSRRWIFPVNRRSSYFFTLVS